MLGGESWVEKKKVELMNVCILNYINEVGLDLCFYDSRKY